MDYRYVTVLCEGPSEESFIKKVLGPYMQKRYVWLTPVILGGVSHYAGIRRELKRLGKDSSCYLTTMLDYYKLPQDTPGVHECKETDVVKIAEYIERCMKQDLDGEIQSLEYLPNIMMHEYEALLFSDVSCFEICDGVSANMLKQLKDIRETYLTPEHINNSEQTAPSKRIIRIYDSYQKVVDGTAVAEMTGIEKMMEECPYFARWVQAMAACYVKKAWK